MDSMGRIVIPRKLREKMGLDVGQEYSFFTYQDDEGRNFICIESPSVTEQTLEEARRLVEKFGIAGLPSAARPQS